MNFVSPSTLAGLPLPHAEATEEHDLAVLHDAERDPRHAELRPGRLDELDELGDARVVEPIRGLARERLRRVPVGEPPIEHQQELSLPLLADSVRHVDQRDEPGVLRSAGLRDEESPFVRGNLVPEAVDVRPAVLVGETLDQLERMDLRAPVLGPRGKGRLRGVLRLHIDERHVGVTLGRGDDRRAAADAHRPAGGCSEGMAGDGRLRRIGRHSLWLRGVVASALGPPCSLVGRCVGLGWTRRCRRGAAGTRHEGEHGKAKNPHALHTELVALLDDRSAHS
jgi:hypothetical protein